MIADGGTAPSGTAPTISAPETSATATTGQAMTPVTFRATGTPTPTITETGALPAGVSLSSSGVLSGTPTQSGTYPITVTASNGVSPNASVGFTLSVTAPTTSAPTISSGPSATFAQGAAASYRIVAIGTPAPTCTKSGALPAGVSLSSSCVLSGTPTVAGAFSFTITASNGVAPNAVQAFVLTVAPSSGSSGGTTTSSPTISSGPSATFTEGVAGSYRIVATGTPTPACSESGALPAGVSLSSSCVLSGTPTVAGAFSFTLTASNGVAPNAVQAFVLTVAPSSGSSGGTTTPVVPTFPSSPRPGQRPPAVTFTEGTGGSFQILVTGTPTPTCALTKGSLPPGLTLSKTCLVSGSPRKPGTYTFSVTASNPSGSATQSFVFVVQAPKVVVVHPSGPDYRFTGVLYGALHDRVLSPVSFKGVRVAARGKTLLTLQSNFGFSVHGRLGRVHVVIQRDVRTVKVPETVHGQRRFVARRVFFYAGVLVLVEPAHPGALVFHSFADVSLTGKRVHAVAIGDLVTSVRVRVRAKVHGQERLVWRIRKVAHPLRLAIEMAPSVS